jgi:hypothetical protein
MDQDDEDNNDGGENPFTTHDEDNMFADEYQGSHTNLTRK